MAELRWLGPDDWRLWRDLRLRSLADSPDAYGSTLEREREFSEQQWRERLASRPLVVVTDDGQPVAMGSGWRPDDERFEIVAMWVEPAHRGRGLSTLVLRELVRQARSEGRRVGLCVTRGNDAARTAYERFGFVPTGEAQPLREGSDKLVDLMVLPDAVSPD